MQGNLKRRITWLSVFLVLLFLMVLSAPLFLKMGVDLAFRYLLPNAEIGCERVSWKEGHLLLKGIRVEEGGCSASIPSASIAFQCTLRPFYLHMQMTVEDPEVSIERFEGFIPEFSSKHCGLTIDVPRGHLSVGGEELFFKVESAQEEEKRIHTLLSYDPDFCTGPLLAVDFQWRQEQLSTAFELEEVECAQLISLLSIVYPEVKDGWEHLEGVVGIKGGGSFSWPLSLDELGGQLFLKKAVLSNSKLKVEVEAEDFQAEFSYLVQERDLQEPFWKPLVASLSVKKGKVAFNGWGVFAERATFVLEPESDPSLSLQGALLYQEESFPLELEGKGFVHEDRSFWLELQAKSEQEEGFFSLCSSEEGVYILQADVTAERLGFRGEALGAIAQEGEGLKLALQELSLKLDKGFQLEHFSGEMGLDWEKRCVTMHQGSGEMAIDKWGEFHLLLDRLIYSSQGLEIEFSIADQKRSPLEGLLSYHDGALHFSIDGRDQHLHCEGEGMGGEWKIQKLEWGDLVIEGGFSVQDEGISSLLFAIKGEEVTLQGSSRGTIAIDKGRMEGEIDFSIQSGWYSTPFGDHSIATSSIFSWSSEGIALEGSIKEGTDVHGLEGITFFIDPKLCNLSAKTTYEGVPLWVHLGIDLQDPKAVMLKIQESPESSGLRLLLRKTPSLICQSIQGECAGLRAHFVKKENSLLLLGDLQIDMQRFSQFLPQEMRREIEPFEIGSGYRLSGELQLPDGREMEFAFRGHLEGRDFELCGTRLALLESDIELHLDRCKLAHLHLEDAIGTFRVPQIKCAKEEKWIFEIPLIQITHFHPGPSHTKCFSLPLMSLMDVGGELGDPSTFSGVGSLSFATLPGDLPAPISGEVECELRGRELHLTSLKNAFGAEDHSEFYLMPEEEPSYLTLTGDLHIDLKRKQNMSAEPSTLKIRGTLESPSFIVN
jgi:hypothetical protein